MKPETTITPREKPLYQRLRRGLNLWRCITQDSKPNTLLFQPPRKKLYQKELDKLNKFTSENGLTFSFEKSHMMLFSSGYNPEKLPSFKISDSAIEYNQIIFTSKWNCHMEYILPMAWKPLNFLKVVSGQNWVLDTSTFIYLSTTLLCSNLKYGQEIFLSAPKWW